MAIIGYSFKELFQLSLQNITERFKKLWYSLSRIDWLIIYTRAIQILHPNPQEKKAYKTDFGKNIYIYIYFLIS